MAQYSRRYSVVMSKWHFTWCWNAFITLVTLHNSKLPECIYTEGHIAFIPGWFALKHMYMSDCTFAMSDCISQMLETHFGSLWAAKIALIDAEPHGKRIPRHSLRVPSFLQTTTCLQGSVRFPTSPYTDEERYGWCVTLTCIMHIFH